MRAVFAIVAGSFIVLAWVVANSHATYAQSSVLLQKIEPIECVYTTVLGGGTSSINSTCDNQPVPTVSEVVINAGSPFIVGTYESATARSLRVWLNSQWYTLGVDSRLTTNGDIWTLNLSENRMLLPTGIYTVIVEVETIGGLLLRNTHAATFSVPPNTGATDSPILQNSGSDRASIPLIPTYFAVPPLLQLNASDSALRPIATRGAVLIDSLSPTATNNKLIRWTIAGVIVLGLIFLIARYAIGLYRR